MLAMDTVHQGDYEALQTARRRSRFLLAALISTAFILLIYVWSGGGSSSAVHVKNAVAVFKGPVVEGTVHFNQALPGGLVKISGNLKNVAPNAYRGFHIHELGDATNGCLSSGSHYNPEAKHHGAPQDSVRHVGDLGNVRSNASGIVVVDISDHKISLNGRFSIIGRTVVIHEGTDDLGKGGNSESLNTGNAGGRAGCGVIGIASS